MDWESNTQHIISAIESANHQDINILCLPELCITGYGCEDAFYAPDVRQQALNCLDDIKQHTSGIIVAVGLPLEFRNKIYNVVCVLANKNILGFVCKQHLPNYGVFYEDRWFHRWPAGVRDEIVLDEIKYPIGDFVFDFEGITVGLEICEDAWIANRPGRRHFDRGVDIIMNPSASPFTFNKFMTRERLVIDASRAFSCAYVYTNLLGNESGRLIFDGDAMIASNGHLLESSPRFSYADFTLTTAVIDIETNRLNHAMVKSPVVNGNWKVSIPFRFPDNLSPTFHTPKLEPFERGGYLKEEEFARAVSLGLFDYLRKSYSQGFTISLSGGADSSACTALCGLMIRLAEESIGFEALKTRLGYIKKIQDAKNIEDISHEIIHTIYQGTENSSQDTLASAEQLAQSMGATFYRIDINGLVENYTELIESEIGRKLSWKTDDIPLQNIQARVRAPSVWLLTNLTNHLLISTSNRSEVAVGYATMDGDTAGSISPIAGIEKFWLRQWLIWLETIGCEVSGRHIKIEGLKKVNSLAPTAELRPKDQKQTDEADLMPYEVLNAIENLAVRDKKSPLDCFKYLEVKYADQIDKQQLMIYVERFFKLWSRNQWKRERYAISFHLDDYNLDPRSWCRFPILSGGYKRELEELKDYVNGKARRKKGVIGF